MRRVPAILILLSIFTACEEERPANVIPSCVITEPGEVNYFYREETVDFIVEADDEDGEVSQVALYIDNELLAVKQDPPYEFQWTDAGRDTGTYFIIATATDDRRSNSSAYLHVKIIETGTDPIPPVADFSYNESMVKTEWIIAFTDSSTHHPDRWHWDFGDGNTSNKQHPKHAYFTEGSYSVTLTASNVFGTDSLMKKDIITVLNTDPRDYCFGCDTVKSLVDIDGNEYKTKKIGSRLWMTENLKTQHFNDGTPIPYDEDREDWSGVSGAAYSWYDHDSSAYHDSYGILYNWYAIETDKLCPSGWHVANMDDWYELIYEVGDQNNAGGKLKERGTEHWLSPNFGASDSRGFKALPGGFRVGSTNGFYGMGEEGKFWQKDDLEREAGPQVWITQLDYDKSELFIYSSNPRSGSSVRCVLDRPEF